MILDNLYAMLAKLDLMLPLSILLAALFIYLVAGIVKGMLGIGFPTAAVSLMAQVTDARTAITLVIMPMLVTNIWQVYRSRRFLSSVFEIRLLLIIMMIVIGLFSQLASVVRIDLLTLILGIIVSVYSLHSLFASPLLLNPEWDKQAQIASGVGAGVMGGLVSVWAPPILIYLTARRMPKEEFVATVGVILLLGSLVLFVSYQASGILSNSLLTVSSLLVIPSLVGFTAGETIRNRLSAQRFQRLLLWFFFLMGLNLIRRAVS